ncbi:MAG: enoyl-ACP reductase FabI [Moorea sp. SIO2B7]|nr:enoyl-ACP reductase FabI [Moorena sp. SIO2B7]
MLNLTGKNALVTGIANQNSIAWSIAQQLHKAGVNLGITFLPDPKGLGRFKKKVEQAIAPFTYDFLTPCNVADDSLIQSTFETVKEKWGKLDILIHCLAFTRKEGISGEFSNASRECFCESFDISSYSLVAMSKAAKPLMTEGGSIITLSYLGGLRVVPNYNVMGVCKAALEMNVRYLAAEFGSQNIRVNAISAGLIRTLASSAIAGIDDMLKNSEKISPLKRNVTPLEVGNTAAFLASDLASGITGQVIYVDAGYSIMSA